MRGVFRNTLVSMARTPKFTREELLAALKAHDYELTRTAVQLEVSPSTVWRAMERHGIRVETERRVVLTTSA